MTLLAGRVLVVRQDLIDDRMERPQLRSVGVFLPGVWRGLRLNEHLAYLAAGVMERAGDRSDAHPIPFRPANSAVIVHRKHPQSP